MVGKKSGRPQLILDIGGVLLANFSSQLWRRIAAETGISDVFLRERFMADIKEALWTGTCTEEEFWVWLAIQAPSVNRSQAREWLFAYLTPLPAIRCLPDWSEFADIHLLSNHLIEWITPVLSGSQQYIQSMTISSAVGFRKPDPRIYEHAHAQLNESRYVLFVDD